MKGILRCRLMRKQNLQTYCRPKRIMEITSNMHGPPCNIWSLILFPWRASLHCRSLCLKAQTKNTAVIKASLSRNPFLPLLSLHRTLPSWLSHIIKKQNFLALFWGMNFFFKVSSSILLWARKTYLFDGFQ